MFVLLRLWSLTSLIPDLRKSPYPSMLQIMQLYWSPNKTSVSVRLSSTSFSIIRDIHLSLLWITQFQSRSSNYWWSLFSLSCAVCHVIRELMGLKLYFQEVFWVFRLSTVPSPSHLPLNACTTSSGIVFVCWRVFKNACFPSGRSLASRHRFLDMPIWPCSSNRNHFDNYPPNRLPV